MLNFSNFLFFGVEKWLVTLILLEKFKVFFILILTCAKKTLLCLLRAVDVINVQNVSLTLFNLFLSAARTLYSCMSVLTPTLMHISVRNQYLCHIDWHTGMRKRRNDFFRRLSTATRRLFSLSFCCIGIYVLS